MRLSEAKEKELWDAYWKQRVTFPQLVEGLKTIYKFEIMACTPTEQTEDEEELAA